MILLLFVAAPLPAWRAGPPPDRVGACGFGDTCRAAGCHATFPIGSATLMWELLQEAPVPGPLPSAYIPCETYQLRLELVDTDPDAEIWGFELAALRDCPLYTSAGGMTPVNPGRVRRFQGIRETWYLSHACSCPTEDPTCCGYVPPGPDPDVNYWSFLWTAPRRGTGLVSFPFAINAANHDGTPENDRIVLGEVFLPEEPCTVPLITDLRVRRSPDCDGGSEGVELVYAPPDANDTIRRTFGTAELADCPHLWAESPGTCQPLDDGSNLTFYSVGRRCDLGGEGH